MRLTPVHERWLVILVALHTLIIGIVFMIAPDWAVKFGGWSQPVRPVFFGRQVGIFHLALASGYLIEHFRYRGIYVIVAAKSVAFVFLLLATVIDPVPWAVPVCGVVDGAIALVVWQVHRRVNSGKADDVRKRSTAGPETFSK
jgi:hypothetical protein